MVRAPLWDAKAAVADLLLAQLLDREPEDAIVDFGLGRGGGRGGGGRGGGGGGRGGGDGDAAGPSRGVGDGVAALSLSASASAAYEEAVKAIHDGMIFGCKNETYDENMAKMCFGLPEAHLEKVKKINSKTAIFLLNYSNKNMSGIFLANGNGGLNLIPDAWATNKNLGGGPVGGATTPFPAQVRVQWHKKLTPIHEHVWRCVERAILSRAARKFSRRAQFSRPFCTTRRHIPTVKKRPAANPKAPVHYELWLNKRQAHDLIKCFFAHAKPER